MRVRIVAIGRFKRGPESDLVGDYVSRGAALGRPVGINSIDIIECSESKAVTANLRKSEEAKALRAASPPANFRIALDEHGELVSTQDFVALLRKRLTAGTADLSFLIGGPDGHDPASLNSVDSVLSLGRMTWPHRLARVMLAEQIYRAVTIMVNHPYHRS